MTMQDGSTESVGDKASKIIQIEELLAKVSEKKKQVLATRNEFRKANKSLQDEVAKDELTSFATLHEYMRVELEVQPLMAKK